jgi:formate-dependent nitrite reductase membrane component NrfD
MPHEWGLLIVVYLFLGGLSGGALALSAVAALAGGDRFSRVARMAAFVAPWPVLMGTGLLVLDLGRPLHFWKLLVAVEPRSPMWIGTWLLTLFALVSLPYANLFLPVWLRLWRPGNVARWKRRLALAGLPLGIAVGIYTGVLLGVLVARPLWNTPLLAQLFLVSALSTAAAFVLLLLRRVGSEDERRALAAGDAALIGLELAVIAWMLIDARVSGASTSAAAAALATGAIGWTFWIGVVALGLLAPLAVEIAGLRHMDRRPGFAWIASLERIAPLLVVAGGFLLRWVIVYAGQSTGLVA